MAKSPRLRGWKGWRRFAFWRMRLRGEIRGVISSGGTLKTKHKHTFMRIGITGITGLIGRHVAEQALKRGWEVVGYSRSADSKVDGVREMLAQPRGAGWELPEPERPLDALIHLAGESVLGLWTAGKRERIRDSRVDFTEKMVPHLAKWKTPPKGFICGSAVGFYGSRGDEVLTEASAAGNGFLVDVCVGWEAAAARAKAAFGARVVMLRTGVVLAREGGAFPLMKKAFSLGAGGRLGSGKQWMPWIHIRDEAGLILWAAETASVEGPLNLSGPAPERNTDLTKKLAKALHRPAFIPAPAFAMKALLGDVAEETLLTSQRVVPEAAQQGGYVFEFATLDAAIADLLAN